MSKTGIETKHRRIPIWRDWMLTAITSVVAILVLSAGFAWWSGNEARESALLGVQARLDSIGRAVEVYAEREGVGPREIDAFIAVLGPRNGLVTAERLEQGVTPHHVNRDIVSALIPLPDEMGSLHLVDVLTPEPASSKFLFPALFAGGLMLAVALVGLAATRRTAGLRRVGSALRAVDEGEKDNDILHISERFGPDALTWNNLLISLSDLDQAPTDAPGDRRDNSMQAGMLPNGTLDAIPFGLIAVDESGRALFCNGAAAAMLGINRSDIIGNPVSTEEAFEQIVPAIETVAHGGTPRTTVEIVRGEGARRDVLRVTVRALRKDDDATMLIILEDITQMRIADEARNGFVAQATHELRAPLTNIRLLVEEVIDIGTSEPTLLARSLNTVNQEARRLERVVADMLSVSEIEAATLSLQLDDTPLSRLFQDLETDYKAQANEKSISLSFDLPAKLDTIRADREKLTLLLHNVLGNAIKYTPEDGSVELAVEQDEAGLTVRVRDSGPGIAAEDHERVFQKFFRTDQARMSEAKGSGLGLALAREIARLHGGDITLESERDHGSTFITRIPNAMTSSRSEAA